MGDDFVAAIKRVVADPGAGPVLNDLVNAEADLLIATLGGDQFELTMPVSDEAVVERLERYARAVDRLSCAVALGARWSGEVVRPLWGSLLERAVAGIDRAGGESVWRDLSRYPSALLLYASGVGALAGDRYDNLAAILTNSRVYHRNELRLAIEVLHPIAVMNPQQAARVIGLPDTFAPISDRLAADLRPMLADVVPDDAAYHRLFDRFEYLLGLVYLDMTNAGWGPTGRFAADQYGTGIDGVVEAEIKEAGESWMPLGAGLFGGSLSRLEESLNRWRTHVEASRRQARFHHIR